MDRVAAQLAERPHLVTDPTVTESFDAIVIGAGVIGCAVALELTRRGLRTVSVDKLPGAGYGSTSSSSAVVRFNYSTPSGVALAYEGLQYWKDWPNHVASANADAVVEFLNVPLLNLKSPDEPQTRFLDHCQRYGIGHEDLNLDQLRERYPHVDFRVFGPPAALDDHDAPFWGEPTAEHHGAVVQSEAGYISDPLLAAQNLWAAAEAEGAQFRFRQTVVSIDRSAHGDPGARVAGVTLSDGGKILAPVVVNVGGPHSSLINKMAGVDGEMSVGTRALRREVYVVPAPDDLDFEAEGLMFGDLDVGVYFRPESGNNVCIGSAEPECDELEWIEDPDNFRESLTDDEFQLLVLRTSRRLKGLGVPHTKRGVTSLYDVTPDWTPIYDRSALDGYYMAIGTSGNQFKNAAVAGHIMAELITAVEAGRDHDADPVIVTGKYTGHEIDLGTFSRRRQVTEDSASTVLG